MNVGVLAFVPDRWGGPWMPRHQILMRLSKHFPVVWVDRVSPWYRLLRHNERPAPMNDNHLRIIGDGNFTVHTSSKLLCQYSRPAWLANWTNLTRVRRGVRLLHKSGCKQIVLYLWRPDFRYALNAHSWAMTLYHIDDEYSFKEQDLQISDDERVVIERSDHVIIHSTALMANKGHINCNTSLIPNGVDFAAYARPQDEPVDLAVIPGPRLGYIGVIKKQLDLSLLVALASSRPDLSLVMVGPVFQGHDIQAEIEALRKLDNVWFLGHKSPQELPAYTQHLDIGLLPYRVNDYTNAIYPLKLHEYLAAGIKVLSTPIETAKGFAGTIRIADGVDEWSTAVSTMLAGSDDEQESRLQRQKVAAAHDWDGITERIANLIRAGTDRASGGYI